MVHVEIWLGDGEKTLGARRQAGVVEIHDSYRYVSKTYGDMQYHFRSIDTWLQGVCKRCDAPVGAGPASLIMNHSPNGRQRVPRASVAQDARRGCRQEVHLQPGRG